MLPSLISKANTNGRIYQGFPFILESLINELYPALLEPYYKPSKIVAIQLCEGVTPSILNRFKSSSPAHMSP